jgi:hypothetical protein
MASNQCQVVSGIESLAGVSRDIRCLLLVGRGRRAQMWALERIRENVPETNSPAKSDVLDQKDRLAALAFAILRFCFQATVARAKICRRILLPIRMTFRCFLPR